MLNITRNTETRWPNAIWAWEFLRRNPQYRREYQRFGADHPGMGDLESGSRLIVGQQRYEQARRWGLLFPANPDLTAHEAGVFWKPSVFPATIPVSLRDPERERERGRLGRHSLSDMIILSDLACRRLIFESINKSRHVVLAPRRYWIQLYCDSSHPLDDNALVSFRIDGAAHANKRMLNMQQLLRLHRSSGRNLKAIRWRRDTQKLKAALMALDVHAMDGSYRDIAIAIFGRSEVRLNWEGGQSSLKQTARRALERGRVYRDGKYRELLG